MPSLEARLNSNVLWGSYCCVWEKKQSLSTFHSRRAGENPDFDHLWRVFLFLDLKNQESIFFPRIGSQRPEPYVFFGEQHTIVPCKNSLEKWQGGGHSSVLPQANNYDQASGTKWRKWKSEKREPENFLSIEQHTAPLPWLPKFPTEVQQLICCLFKTTYRS